MAYRGYKYRIYPNDEARAFFARCFGATRYCYNYCVREYDAALKEGRELSGFDIAARLREHTKDLKWMAGVDYYVKEFAPKRFDNALMKYKRHEANRPHEHKKGERPSVSYTTSGDNIKVDFKHDLVQLPKIGLVRARLHRSFDGEIASATIKREADGKYYISLTVSSEDVAAPMKPHSEAGTVGVDVGLRHLATLSDGTFIDLPDTQRSLARIVFLKKRLSLAKPGSKRYYRTKLQIARLYHHLANVTKDAHRKAAARLCRDYDTICMETLNVKGMRQGKGSNKTAAEIAFNAELHRAALALFHDRVERKAADTGTNFVKIDRWEPSTKRCHRCGYVLDSIDLDTKEWTCPECGTHHDRDVNAAINIRNLGIEKLQERATTRILPPAEGNVKPAKKTTAGCDLRTGKRTVRINRPPKAQIAIGSAPPRIFYKPRIVKEPCFEIPEELKYFKFTPLATKASTPPHELKKWMKQLTYGEIPEEMMALHDRILTAIKILADELRHIKIRNKERASTNKVLGMMNKVVRADWLIAEVISVQPNYTVWRSKKRTSAEIQIINRVVTREFPDKLDAMISRLKSFAYESSSQPIISQIEDIRDKYMLKELYLAMHLKIHRVARKACITTHTFSLWFYNKYKYGERYFSYEEIMRFLYALKELAAQLRGMEIKENSKRGIERQLKDLEKETWLQYILWDAGFYPAEIYDNTNKENKFERSVEVFKCWRASEKSLEDIHKINQIVCYELPELIDRFVASEMNALNWEMQSSARSKC